MSHPAASVGDTESFFQSPQQSHFARRWSAAQVDRLRNPGGLEEYPLANTQGLKLRNKLSEVATKRETCWTFGAADPIMAHEMGEAGFETLYQSGANATLCETPTFDCGGDLADYTYDTLPKRVKQIVQNQLHWARVDRTRDTCNLDRLVPIIADGDSGHGNSTATMKLVKLFLDAGAAAIHFDDMLSGEKNFSVGSLTHVLVPVREHIRRLLAAKLQLDIAGVHTVLIARTDSESASRITSAIDPLDRPFILGRTKLGHPSLSRRMMDSKSVGAVRLAEEQAWEQEARLCTLDEAVREQCSLEDYKSFESPSRGLDVADALLIARQYGVIWDCEGCRNTRGWYRYRGNIEAAIARSKAYADYADMVWSCAPGYNLDNVKRYASAIHEKFPGKWMGYNWSFGTFENESDEDIASLVRTVGRLGFVWQFNPQAGFYEQGVAMNRFAKAMYKDHMLPYVKSIDAGTKEGVSVVDWYEQAGDLTDAMTDAIQ
ncbi:isocitrate lyase [Kwoniella pini CBS 10737]|uniref:Isocitrate lyase n=1 Tax=Kwoniella pini CBS 10737 TaxID=1296096 RepID=A0AAJ8KYV3_9TREE